MSDPTPPPPTDADRPTGGVDDDLPLLGDEDDGGFEKVEPRAPVAPPPTHAGTPPTLAGGPPPTLGGALPPPTLMGGTPGTHAGGPPPTLMGTTRPAQPPPDLPQTVPGFTLMREVARGQTGACFEAVRESDGLRVAVKVLGEAAVADAGLMKSARAAADKAKDLLHDNVARVVDVHLDGEGPFFVASEWAEGEPIASVLRRARMPVDRVARIGIQAARALHQGHERGLLHGRVSPSHLVLDMGDRTLCVGIGTPSYTAQGRPQPGPAGGAAYSSYAAPEMAGGGRSPDRRADVFALGAVLYEMMTGQPPYPPATAKDLVRRGRGEEPQAPRKLNPRIPPPAEAILLQAIAHDPGRRYATAQALAEDLERFRRGERVRARGASVLSRHRGLVALGAAVVVAGIAVPVVLVWNGAGETGGGSVAAPPLVGGGGLPTTDLGVRSLEDVRTDFESARLEAARDGIRQILRGAKPGTEALVLGARIARAAGDVAEAEAALARADAAAPEVKVERAELDLTLGRHDAALTGFGAALSGTPSAVTAQAARLGRAQALRGLGKPAEAVQVLRDAGGDVAVLVALADALLAAGDFDEAEKAARRAVGQPTPPPQARYVLGRVLEAQGKPRLALTEYKAGAGARGEPRLGRAIDRLERETQRLDQFAGAEARRLQGVSREARTREAVEQLLADCAAAIDRAPPDRVPEDLRVMRARLALTLGRHAEAERECDAVLSSGPARGTSQATAALLAIRSSARFARGDLAGTIEDTGRYMQTLAQTIQRASGQQRGQALVEFIGAATRRGLAHVLWGDFGMAMADTGQAVGNMPEQASASLRRNALVARAMACGFAGDVKECATAIELLRGASGDDTSGLALCRGALAVAEGDLAGAGAAFDEEAALTTSQWAGLGPRFKAAAAALRRPS